MIEVEQLTKRYGTNEALSSASFIVEPKQIVGFLGVNGSGKTTTMDIIAGCIGADLGTVRICGHDVNTDALRARAKLGYLPDTPPIPRTLTVEEVIYLQARLHGVETKKLKPYVEAAISTLALGSVRRHNVTQLSKGFRQRVAFALAIVHKPQVLVLDEPTEGLDPFQIVEIRKLIREFGRDYTILLSSHILSEVETLCDRLVIIHQGRIKRTGTCKELSHALAQATVCQMRLARPSSGMVAILQTIAGIRNPQIRVQPQGDLFEFQVEAEQNLDQTLEAVSQTMVSGGFGLRELSVRRQSLEDLFLDITH